MIKIKNKAAGGVVEVLGVMLQRQERLVWAVAKVIIFT
jgi:hypothetical protein